MPHTHKTHKTATMGKSDKASKGKKKGRREDKLEAEERHEQGYGQEDDGGVAKAEVDAMMQELDSAAKERRKAQKHSNKASKLKKKSKEKKGKGKGMEREEKEGSSTRAGEDHDAKRKQVAEKGSKDDANAADGTGDAPARKKAKGAAAPSGKQGKQQTRAKKDGKKEGRKQGQKQKNNSKKQNKQQKKKQKQQEHGDKDKGMSQKQSGKGSKAGGKQKTMMQQHSHGLMRWLDQPVRIDANIELDSLLPMSSLELEPRLSQRIMANGFTKLFPVQAVIVPDLLRARRSAYPAGDICVSAPTGSGKTLAYVIPILNRLCRRVVPRLRAVVVTPTRQLVQQVHKVFVQCATDIHTDSSSPIRIAMCAGASSFAKEQVCSQRESVCVCVCERERECVCVCERERVCVCVCLSVFGCVGDGVCV